MRWLWLLFVVACQAPPVLRPRPHMRVAIAGCRGGASSSDVALDAAFDADTPLVILQEEHLHGAQPPSPTIAVWADGEVVFGGTSYLMAATMPKHAAAKLARDVYRMLDDVPYATDVWNGSGGILLQITVRDGTRWRSARVYGDDPERVLAVARGTAAPPKTPPPPKPAATAGERIEAIGVDFAELLAERPWPPRAFADAYRRLVESVPTTGHAAEPHDYDVLFIALDRGIRARRPAVGWPHDLPTPPDLAPASCNYLDREELDFEGGCRFTLGPSDNAAVERFDEARRRGGRARAVTVNGIAFAVRFDGTWRGQRTIDAVTTCAGQLAGPDHGY